MGIIRTVFPHYMLYPRGATPSYGTHTLDGTADQIEFVWRAPKAATITHVAFRQTSITGTPGTVRVGLQSVSATTGLATGTWLAGGLGYADYNSWNASNNGTFVQVALGTSVTVARGDVVAMVMDVQAVGTWDASNLAVISRDGIAFGPFQRLPYANTGSGAAISKQAIANPPFVLRSSTEGFGQVVQGINALSYSSSSTPDEQGAIFTLPADIGTSYTIPGVLLGGDFDAGDFDLVLYDSDGTTVLQSVSIDKDQAAMNTADVAEFWFDEVTLSSLTPGTTYRLTIKPTTTTAITSLMAYDVAQANDLIRFTGGSATGFYFTSRTDAGAWSETTTRIPSMQLIVDLDGTSGSSGGGPLVGGRLVN